MRLVGKVAIVTGGGSGIGETTAVLFGREGAKVLVVDNRADAAKATVKTIKETGGTACPVCADVTKAADVEAMIRTAVELYSSGDWTYCSTMPGFWQRVVWLTSRKTNGTE